MAIKTFKPYTPARRNMTVSAFDGDFIGCFYNGSVNAVGYGKSADRHGFARHCDNVTPAGFYAENKTVPVYRGNRAVTRTPLYGFIAVFYGGGKFYGFKLGNRRGFSRNLHDGFISARGRIA